MDALIAKLRAQRELHVDLGDGMAVRLLRPPEAEFALFGTSTGAELAAKYAIGWSGFTEVHFLGAAVGSDEAIEFTPERWSEIVSDDAEWIRLCVVALTEAISARLDAKGIEAKN